MKRDKKWLLREFRKLTFELQNGYAKVKAVDILPLIDQLDSPEKVVIPQFVADWWEHDDDSVTMYEGVRIEKKHKFDLVSYFQDRGLIDSLSKVEVWIDENESTFLDLVNGKVYEVEKEKLYYVLNDHGQTLLVIIGGAVCLSSGYAIRDNNKDKYQLTEKQIKEYDPRYWIFAVEVTE